MRSEVFSQCMMVPVSLEERTVRSETIILGELIDQLSYYDEEKRNIYTLNLISVTACLKGRVPVEMIGVISEGGVVGDMAQITFPSLQLQFKTEYVLFLSSDNHHIDHRSYRNLHPEIIQAEAYAGAQGAITKQFGFYRDAYSEPICTETELFSKIQNITKTVITDPYGNTFTARTEEFAQPAMQPILSFTPPVTNSGTVNTADYVSITGSEFGITPGSVFYTNAGDGGATFISSEVASDNVFWSDAIVANKPPSGAGTGPINVNGGANSVDDLTIHYSHLSINSDFNGFAEVTRQRYYLRNLNDAGGMTFLYNAPSGFSDNIPAMYAFQRALESWRCAVHVNFNSGGTTSTGYAADDTCVVLFDGSLPAGVLARATSRFAGASMLGCTVTNTVWWLTEIDVQVRPDPPTADFSWEYGPDFPSATEYDMQSVLTHELGHGIGLNHSMYQSELMYFSIGAGLFKRTISDHEMEGGSARVEFSIIPTCFNPAGSGAEMIALDENSCSFPAAELAIFTAEYISENSNVLLSWTTTTEYNSDYFLVERSVDGYIFSAIGTVEAAGLSLKELNYHFIDQFPEKGLNYYRLQQFDHNGNFLYSNIATVFVDDISLELEFIPNPADETVMILLNGFTDSPVSIRMYDATGKLVIDQNVVSMESIGYIPVDLTDIESGMYFITVEVNGMKMKQSLIVN